FGSSNRTSAMSVGVACMVRPSIHLIAQHALQVVPVAALGERGRERLQLARTDPARAIRDLLRARDLQPLPLLQGGDELAGLEQAVVRAGIEPGIAAAQDLDAELAAVEVV